MSRRAYTDKTVFRLVLSLSILAFISISAHAQRKELTPKQRKDLELRVEKMQPLLDEFHQGKRDDSDGHAIMRKMLQYYSILGSTNTATYQGLLQEWKSLRQKHPEYVTSPPRELHEHAERRAGYKRHDAEIAEKASHFTPKDSRPKLFWSDRHLAAVFQHRIEFYELPAGVDCVESYMAENNIEPIRLHRREGTGVDSLRFRGPGGDVKLTPKKSITFGRWLEASQWTKSGAFAVTAFWNRYTASDDEEHEILQQLDKKKTPFKWDDAKAAHQEFYGVVSVDGDVLAEIPFKSHYPDSVMQALYAAPDGTILFGVGSLFEPKSDNPEENGEVWGKVSEIMSWSREKGIQHLSVQDALSRFPEMKQWQQELWAK